MDPKSSTDIFAALHRIKLMTDARLAVLEAAIEDARQQVLRDHEVQVRVALRAAGRVG